MFPKAECSQAELEPLESIQGRLWQSGNDSWCGWSDVEEFVKGMGRWASVTLLDVRGLSSELLEWLGHFLGHFLCHLAPEAAWLLLGSRLESGICCIPTKGLGMAGLCKTGLPQLILHFVHPQGHPEQVGRSRAVRWSLGRQEGFVWGT